ncbi:MAG: tRNA-guanine transglycosylase, partial [Verrucomicrobiae bacterium]|nr:tRNA-guanine transglycosylase [Verrucomicrobiae bacterium]
MLAAFAAGESEFVHEGPETALNVWAENTPSRKARQRGRRVTNEGPFPPRSDLRYAAGVFDLLKTDATSKARLGRLTTSRGVIDTPVFMPVGTQASVKALDPRELREMGTQILLGNTYHLSIRPGMEIIQAGGGLHSFMGWDAPIL